MKRQRPAAGDDAEGNGAKRQKTVAPATRSSAGGPPHPVLSRVYPHVVTLRQYVLAKLTCVSKCRRRRLQRIGLGDDPEKELGRFLDQTWVGTAGVPSEGETRRRCVELQQFGKEVAKTSARTGGDDTKSRQHEIANFVIWLLFKRSTPSRTPSHLLCHGYSRSSARRSTIDRAAADSPIPGLYAVHSNAHAHPMKQPNWTKLMSLLKDDGDQIMISLLLDCSIFEPTAAGNGSLLQISGTPISAGATKSAMNTASASSIQPDKSSDKAMMLPPPQPKAIQSGGQTFRTPASIQFVRSRILYGKPNLNAKGTVYYGLPQIHVFNRCCNLDNSKQNLHVMKYIFPLSFKLHNPFTSNVDRRETAMKLKDYTTREKEIIDANIKLHPSTRDRVPKRLSSIANVVRWLRKRHASCSYTALFHHHCHSKLDDRDKIKPIEVATEAQRNITDFATSHAEVASFCKAVMAHLLPVDCFGGEAGPQTAETFRSFFRFIDTFVRLRKRETLSLHDLCNGMPLKSFEWLCPPGVDPKANLSSTDFAARSFLLCQFFYFVIDSILMPLIRSHFHVTESNTDRNHLFYFRHDVWRLLTEPTITSMKMSSLVELPMQQAPNLIKYLTQELQEAAVPRLLRAAKFRLVPKKDNFRMITNLGLREQVRRGDRTVLDSSTNTKLMPVHQALKAEYLHDRARLGASMFSKGEIGPRLQSYKQRLLAQGWKQGQRLYFAKVDIQSCFDTIPQDKALQLLSKILAADVYNVQKYADVSPPSPFRYITGFDSGALRTTYASHSAQQNSHSTTNLSATDRPCAPFAVRTPIAPETTEQRARLRNLLREHVTQHTLKIGKKEYRQTQGVPQGSIVSTLLCNFFYAEFERLHLAFLRTPASTMMRLVDDFLVISTDAQLVRRFRDVMHAGNAEFGLTVKESKTVTNLETETQRFVYCGLEISTSSLEVLKQAGGNGVQEAFDVLTVERSKEPGKLFYRKTLNGLKIQLQPVLLDSSLNSSKIALTNLYTLLQSSATRSYAYTKSKRIGDAVLIKTISDLAAMSSSAMRSNASKQGQQMSAHMYSERQKQCLWLASKAHYDVFQRRQTGHAELLQWLVKTMTDTGAGATQRSFLEAIVNDVTRASTT